MRIKPFAFVLLGLVTILGVLVVGSWVFERSVDMSVQLAQLDAKVNGVPAPIPPTVETQVASQAQITVERLARLERFVTLPSDAEGRRILQENDLDYLGRVRPEIADDWNADVSTTALESRPYTDFDYIITFPFNTRWGNGAYTVSPYERGEDGMRFGPIPFNEMAGAVRYGKFSVMEKRSLEAIMEDEKSRSEFCGGESEPPERVRVGVYQLVRFQKEYCEGVTTYYLLPGKRHTYVFIAYAWPDESLLKWTIERFKEKE